MVSRKMPIFQLLRPGPKSSIRDNMIFKMKAVPSATAWMAAKVNGEAHLTAPSPEAKATLMLMRSAAELSHAFHAVTEAVLCVERGLEGTKVARTLEVIFDRCHYAFGLGYEAINGLEAAKRVAKGELTATPAELKKIFKFRQARLQLPCKAHSVPKWKPANEYDKLREASKQTPGKPKASRETKKDNELTAAQLKKRKRNRANRKRKRNRFKTLREENKKLKTDSAKTKGSKNL